MEDFNVEIEYPESFLDEQTSIRNMIDTLYAVQDLRISTGNRLAASLRNKRFSSKDTADESIIKSILSEFSTITEQAKLDSKGKKTATIQSVIRACECKLILNQLHYDLVKPYVLLCKTEQEQLKTIKKFVESTRLWKEFLVGVKGCGHLMAAVCMAYLDPYKARHCSAFWKYAGLDVVLSEDGEGIGRNRSMTTMIDYIAKDGTVKQKRSLTYNPRLKTKLLGVLGGAFLKARDSHYGNIYYGYKNRLIQRNFGNNKAHIHRAALRYAVKMFLRDLWVEWRKIEGLQVTTPYEEVYLDKDPHGDPHLEKSTEIPSVLDKLSFGNLFDE